MIFERSGSARNEGTLRTQGTPQRARFFPHDKSIRVFLNDVPNFNKGTGTHNWEVILNLAELGMLIEALAAADSSKRRAVGAALAPSREALAALLEMTDRSARKPADS